VTEQHNTGLEGVEDFIVEIGPFVFGDNLIHPISYLNLSVWDWQFIQKNLDERVAICYVWLVKMKFKKGGMVMPITVEQISSINSLTNNNPREYLLLEIKKIPLKNLGDYSREECKKISQITTLLLRVVQYLIDQDYNQLRIAQFLIELDHNIFVRMLGNFIIDKRIVKKMNLDKKEIETLKNVLGFLVHIDYLKQ